MKEKLVRDKIKDLSLLDKDGATFREASDSEMPQLFSDKLKEECQETSLELLHNPRDKKKLTEELADVMEVVESICHHYQISKEDLFQIKEEKKIKKGSFIKKVVRKP